MFGAYDQRIAQVQSQRGRAASDLSAARTELAALQSSVREVVSENDSLRRELQEATNKLLQASTAGVIPGGGGGGAATGGGESAATAELETMAQLLRSENNVLLAQRRSLAEEVQALKSSRTVVEEKLRSTTDELTATRGSLRDVTERLQSSEGEASAMELELSSLKQRLAIQDADLDETRVEHTQLKSDLRMVRGVLEEKTRGLEELQVSGAAPPPPLPPVHARHMAMMHPRGVMWCSRALGWSARRRCRARSSCSG
jgi:chromosome segregation ATPase